VDVDGAFLGLTLQVDVEAVVVLGVGKNLCTIEGHDMVGDGLDRLGRKVHIIDAQVSRNDTQQNGQNRKEPHGDKKEKKKPEEIMEC